MYCSQCGAKNPDGAKFCFKCGAKMRNAPTSAAGAVSAPPSEPSVASIGKHAATGVAAASPSTPVAASTSASVPAKHAAAGDGTSAQGAGSPTGSDTESAPSSGSASDPSLKELAQGTATAAANVVTTVHNNNVRAKCLLWGAVYAIGGGAMLISGDMPRGGLLPLLGIIVYGVWLLVGGFTGGWRLVIY